MSEARPPDPTREDPGTGHSAAGPEDPPTSLVPYQTNGGRDSESVRPVLRCPRVDHDRRFWVNVDTGERRPAWCGATICEVCGPRQAWKKALILSHGGASGPPQRYAVLTQLPLDWDKARQKIRDYRRYVQRRGYAWEHAWTVELNPAGTGLHVNVLQKGAYVPQKELQDVWGSIVHVQAVKKRKGPQNVAQYALKEAQKVAGYSLKDAASNLAQHLDVNGGRLVHLSRDYLGGMTQKQVWEEIRGPHVDAGWRMVTL